MPEIRASNCLKAVSSHKIGEACHRKFFWNHVWNIEPPAINLNFWYGGVVGEGVEQLLMLAPNQRTKEANQKKIFALMEEEGKKRASRYFISSEDQEELDVQMDLAKAQVIGLLAHPRIKDIRITEHQVELSVPVKHHALLGGKIQYNISMDGVGTDKSKECMIEIKTAAASTVTDAYFKKLKLDFQINGYNEVYYLVRGKRLKKCLYIVIKKPSKRLKKNQTLEDFIEEIRDDCVDRADWYYIIHEHRFLPSVVRSIWVDIVGLINRMPVKYNPFKPELWQRCNKCVNYGLCPYFPLCTKPKSWHLLLRSYIMREFMYENEKEELCNITEEQVRKHLKGGE